MDSIKIKQRENRNKQNLNKKKSIGLSKGSAVEYLHNMGKIQASMINAWKTNQQPSQSKLELMVNFKKLITNKLFGH